MRKYWQIIFALAICFCIGCIAAAAEDGLTVHFLDVGQGDAIIVQCDGHNMMIDGGDRYSNQFIYSYLRSMELDYFDCIISTHPHEDHIQGLATALVLCDAGIIYSPVTEYDGNGFNDLKRKAEEKNIDIVLPLDERSSFYLGNAEVTILSIPHPDWNLNDQSIIVKVQYGDIRFLFMGDAEWEAEQDLIARGMDISADVLKVGHHGSPTSTSDEFIKAVQPTYAIISVGANNTFGHPAKETLMKLQRKYISVFRTDINGTIVCTSNGQTIGFQMIKSRIKDIQKESEENNTADETEFIADLVIDESFADPASVGDRFFVDFSIDEDYVKATPYNSL